MAKVVGISQVSEKIRGYAGSAVWEDHPHRIGSSSANRGGRRKACVYLMLTGEPGGRGGGDASDSRMGNRDASAVTPGLRCTYSVSTWNIQKVRTVGVAYDS